MIPLRILQRPNFKRKPLTGRVRIMVTISNILMFMGVILLLYVGYLYGNAEYSRYAARGDNNLPAPQPVLPPEDGTFIQDGSAIIGLSDSAEPAPFVPAIQHQIPNTSSVDSPSPANTEQPVATQVNPVAVSSEQSDGRVTGVVPALKQGWSSDLTRIVIPKIDVDSKIVTVGWEVKEQKGQKVAIWQVAEYAVGHHLGSASPGDGNNIVLAGHVGGYGKVFKDLVKLEPGDQITLYSAGKEYIYTVSERIIVDEEGVSAQQQAQNAMYIQPTGQEMITMITCWPATGKNRFSQRVIVRALPYNPSQTNTSN